MNWKKVFWTGLGGAVVGVLGVMAGRQIRKRRAEQPQPVPPDVSSLRIETEELELYYRGKPYLSRTIYSCRPTRFKVWNLLESQASQRDPEEARKGGLRIFHVTPVLEFRSREEDEVESFPEEKFYASLHLRCEKRRRTLPEHLARGDYLEFHKCHVGGSMNGVATGDRILTNAPVSHYEFEG